MGDLHCKEKNYKGGTLAQTAEASVKKCQGQASGAPCGEEVGPLPKMQPPQGPRADPSLSCGRVR